VEDALFCFNVGATGLLFAARWIPQWTVAPEPRLQRRRLLAWALPGYVQRAAMLNDVRLMLERASREASRSGGNAMDSLHLAAAHLLKADEFLTIENLRKSIYRSNLVKVVYLYG
jgi:hypothetical protein